MGSDIFLRNNLCFSFLQIPSLGLPGEVLWKNSFPYGREALMGYKVARTQSKTVGSPQKGVTYQEHQNRGLVQLGKSDLPAVISRLTAALLELLANTVLNSVCFSLKHLKKNYQQFKSWKFLRGRNLRIWPAFTGKLFWPLLLWLEVYHKLEVKKRIQTSYRFFHHG